jgi:hypothetical protein
MASASCLCIRRVGTHKRSPASFPLPRTRRCSTCPTFSRTNRAGVHTSLLSQKPFSFLPTSDQELMIQVQNPSLQERVFLCRKEHLANRGSHSRALTSPQRPQSIDDPYCSVCIPALAYATHDRPKEAFMGGHIPEITCTICAKPVDLSIEMCADEHGKAVHEDCYVKHVTSSRSNPLATVMAD